MFISSVLAFALGIYLQAIQPFPLLLTLGLLLCSLVLIPFAARSSRPIAVLLILFGFCLAGYVRLALVQANGAITPELEETADLYGGRVIESSANIKTIKLSYPDRCAGIRAAFVSDATMPINSEVRLVGSLRELNPSFKNPSIGSWKWLKKLEGIGFELKGKVLSARSGTSLIEGSREYFKKNIERSGAWHTDILKTLTIGDRTSLDQEKNRLFVQTGTSHVLAISGFNVGIISGFFFFLLKTFFGLWPVLRLSGRHTRYAALLTMPFPFAFMFVAGAGVSVIRATIMILVYMLSLFFERSRHPINIMAFSALVILSIYPHSIFAPSFQLTFMSLIFIMVFLENWYQMITRIKWRFVRWTASAVCSTAAATLGTAPIVIYHFFGINPLTVLHNLVAVPLVGVAATSLSLVGMLHGALAPVLWAAGWITEASVRALKILDFGYIWPIVRPNMQEITVYYALLLSIFYIRKKAAVGILVVSLPVLFVTAAFTLSERFNDDLRVSFLDVRGGDSILVEAPHGVRILVDGGGFHGQGFDVGEKVITPLLLAKKVRTLDYVVATHPHSDHIGGLASVLRNFDVRHFVTGNLYPDYAEFRQLTETAAHRGSITHLWRRGDSYHVAPGVDISVLSPPSIRRMDDVNNASLVLLLRHGLNRFLLAGDIGEDVEEEIILSGLAIRADVVKVAHHGSRFSNSHSSLLAIRPKLAVATCGPGAARGLPSPETLARFKAHKIPVLRTDHSGLIEIRSDGKRLTYQAFDGTRGIVHTNDRGTEEGMKR